MPPQAKNFDAFFLVKWPRNDLVMKANIRGSFLRNLKTGIFNQ